MSTSLTTLVIVITLIHAAALAIMIWIRVRRTEADGAAAGTPAISPCAVCGAPSTHRSYDGLDPNAQFNPRTGRYWSTDVAHYPPLCEAH